MDDVLLLEIDGLTKYFGGLGAVRDVSFRVDQGEVLGIMGPNGAGKTTVFNLISGVYRPTSGSVKFRENEITGFPPHKICRLGISRTYQIPQPFANMTALQNLVVAARHGGNMKGKEAQNEAMRILNFCGLLERKDALARDLTLLNLKRLGLARALATRPSLLLMDEVAAGLTDLEVEELLKLIQSIHENGICIVLIEHVMKVMAKAVQRLLVMNEGEVFAEGDPLSIMKSDEVIKIYLGEEAVT
jgi:branched-chain amino acid transport system ATP-binding protein